MQRGRNIAHLFRPSLGRAHRARPRTPRRAPLFPAIYPACRAAPFPSWIFRNVGSEIWSAPPQLTVVFPTRFRRNVPSRRTWLAEIAHVCYKQQRHFSWDVGPVLCVLCASSALGAIRPWSRSRSIGANSPDLNRRHCRWRHCTNSLMLSSLAGALLDSWARAA